MQRQELEIQQILEPTNLRPVTLGKVFKLHLILRARHVASVGSVLNQGARKPRVQSLTPDKPSVLLLFALACHWLQLRRRHIEL